MTTGVIFQTYRKCNIFYRFTCAENKTVAKELMRNYDDTVVGQVMSKICTPQ